MMPRILVFAFGALTIFFLLSGIWLTERAGLNEGLTNRDDPYRLMREHVQKEFGASKGIFVLKRFANGIGPEEIREIRALHMKMERQLSNVRVWSIANMLCSGIVEDEYGELFVSAPCTTENKLFEKQGSFSMDEWRTNVGRSSVYGTLVDSKFKHVLYVLYPKDTDNQIKIFREVAQLIETGSVEPVSWWERVRWMFRTDIYPSDPDVGIGGWIMGRGLIDSGLNGDVFFHILGLGLPLAFLVLWGATGSVRQSLIGVFVVVGANILWTWGEIGVIDTVSSTWGFELKERVYILLAYTNNIVQGLSFSLILFALYNRERRTSPNLARAVVWNNVRKDLIAPLSLIATISFTGFATLFWFEVVAIRELAVMSAVGVLNLIFLACFIMPVVHNYIGGEEGKRFAVIRVDRGCEAVARMSEYVARRCSAGVSMWILAVMGILMAGMMVSGQLLTGTKPLNYLSGTIVERTANYLNQPRNAGFDAVEMYVESKNGKSTDVSFGREVKKFSNEIAEVDSVRRVLTVYDEVTHISNIFYEKAFPDTNEEMEWIFQNVIGGIGAGIRDELYDENGVRVAAFTAMDDMQELLSTCEAVRDVAVGYEEIRVSMFGDACEYVQTDQYVVLGKPFNSVNGQVVVIMFCGLFAWYNVAKLYTTRKKLLEVSLKTGAVMSVPFLFSTFAIFVTMMIAKIPLDVVTASISALAINASTDFTIHFVDSYQKNRNYGLAHAAALSEAYSDKGSVVVADMIQNICCFAVLAISTFVPVQMLGVLMAVMLIYAGVGTLIVMPPLLKWAYK